MSDKITDSDAEEYVEQIEAGKHEQATSGFINTYVLPKIAEYQSTIRRIMSKADKKELSASEMQTLELQVHSATAEVKRSMLDIFRDYVNRCFGKVIFSENEITNAKVKKAILGETVKQFETLTSGALIETDAKVLKEIRAIQKTIILQNQMIAQAEKAGLDEKVAQFKAQFEQRLRKMNPDYYKMAEEGQLIVYRDGSMHRLDEYADMSIRTTVLNVDRTSVETRSIIDGRRVVEFYMRDPRPVESERAICKSVMGLSINGKHLVALDSSAAGILGIQTLDHIKAEGSFGPHCRHSIRALDAAYYAWLEKALFVGEVEVA